MSDLSDDAAFVMFGIAGAMAGKDEEIADLRQLIAELKEENERLKALLPLLRMCSPSFPLFIY